ncbi:hypothetical protein ACSFA8_19465 [Variovorax sp. RT4R15]|uniref:hypothetical protein n=1 Tax=Variovorax sp. RT4R15 TaxID=3443737 RepID=UPI003F44A005
MAKRLDTHNRFAAPQDSAPSRLDELTFQHRFEEREQRATGWRNITFAALAVVLVLVALFLAR